MINILKKDLNSYFKSPVAYIYLTLFMFFAGFYFVSYNLVYGNSAFNYVLYDLTVVFLFTVPILTIKLFCEETRNNTLLLLYTSSQSTLKIVLGKYFAALTLFLIGTVMSFIFPIFLWLMGDIYIGEIFASYIGFILVGASFISVGLLVSCFTDNQFVCSILTLGVLLIIWFIDKISSIIPNDNISGLLFALLIVVGILGLIFYVSKDKIISITSSVILALILLVTYVFDKNIFKNFIGNSLNSLSLLSKVNSLMNGVISLSSIVYYLSFICVMIMITINYIKIKRLS